MKINKSIRVSDYICIKLLNVGIDTAFLITGGGSMHLNDAITRNKSIKSHFLHHEQSLAMAAEGFFRSSRKAAIVNVTTGPGAINAINGVFGAFVDSIPMFVLSGQVKTSTMLYDSAENLRQLGDQEANIYNLVKPVVKYISTPKNIEETIIALKKAVFFFQNGRPGPVWLDIPIDLQSSIINFEEAEKLFAKNIRSLPREYVHPNTKYNKKIDYTKMNNDIKSLINLIDKSNRPLILAGNGIRIAGQDKCLLKIINNFKIPVVSAWNAHDLLPGSNRYNCGKPGTVGDRAGNFAIRNCDLLLVVGSRLNIRQISYNWKSFAKNAKIIMVDIDINEMNKKTLKVFKKYHYNLERFLPQLEKQSQNRKINSVHNNFLYWCKRIKKKYPLIHKKLSTKKNTLNPYIFFQSLYSSLNKKDTVVLGNGTACVVGLQCADLPKGTRVYTNSGSASMGYDLPAAIGSSIANRNKRVLCVTGDGSIMMNIQELASINYKKLPIKVFILDNNGYHSIRQTQKNFFPDNLVGTCKKDGIGFPSFMKLGKAFNIRTVVIKNEEKLNLVLKSKLFLDFTPTIFVINVNQKQEFYPKLKSRINESGKIETPELHDMWPFLSKQEINENLIPN